MEALSSPFPNYSSQSPVDDNRLLPRNSLRSQLSFKKFCRESNAPSFFWEKRASKLLKNNGPQLDFSKLYKSQVEKIDDESGAMDFSGEYVLIKNPIRHQEVSSQIPPTIPPRNSRAVYSFVPENPAAEAIHATYFTRMATLEVFTRQIRFITSGNLLVVCSTNPSNQTKFNFYTFNDISVKDNIESFVNRNVEHFAGNDKYVAVVYEGDGFVTVYESYEDFLKKNNNRQIAVDKQKEIVSICFVGHDLLISLKHGPIVTHNLQYGTQNDNSQVDILNLFSTDGSNVLFPYFIATNPRKTSVNIWKKSFGESMYKEESFELNVHKSMSVVAFDEQIFYFGDSDGNVYRFEKGEAKLIYQCLESPIVGIVVFPEGILIASKKQVHYLKKCPEQRLEYAFELPVLDSKRTISAMTKIGDKVAIGTTSGKVQIYKFNDPKPKSFNLFA